MSKSIQSRYYQALEGDAQGHAIGFMNSECETAWRTREEFHRNSLAYAARLMEKGLGPKDVCLIVLPSNETATTALMGALLIGAIPLLVAPPMLQGAQTSLAQILLTTIERSNAKVVVCADSLAGMREQLEQTGNGTQYLFDKAELEGAAPAKLDPVAPDAESIAAYQLTSGTTGFPKICVWKQGRVIEALDGMIEAMDLNKSDVCFNWTPLYHDMGLVNNFLTCFTSGIPLVMFSPQEFVKKPVLWLKGLQATGTTVTWSPNFGFAFTAKMVKDDELAGLDLSGVKSFWNAAERIHFETMIHFHERFQSVGVTMEKLKTNFGCAENVGGATFSDPHGSFIWERVNLAKLQDERIVEIAPESADETEVMNIVSAGRPHPRMTAKILSEEGEELPDGHVGWLALDTPSRLIGYLDDEEATKEAFHGDLLKTGDLAYMRNGEVFWVGRSKERITIRGKKIDPSDFEPILFKIEGLRPGCFVAFGVDDTERGTQKIVVVSEVQTGNTKTPKQLMREVKAQVNLGLGLEVSKVLLVNKATLTKTSSGKRRHRHFRDLYRKGELAEFEYQHEG